MSSAEVGRVVLEVGVEDAGELALGLGQRGLDGRALALVVVVLDQPHPGVPVAVAQDLAGAVGRAVVDDDQLELARQLGGQDLGDRALDALALVVDRHQDGQHGCSDLSRLGGRAYGSRKAREEARC